MQSPQTAIGMVSWSYGINCVEAIKLLKQKIKFLAFVSLSSLFAYFCIFRVVFWETFHLFPTEYWTKRGLRTIKITLTEFRNNVVVKHEKKLFVLKISKYKNIKILEYKNIKM